VRQVDARGAVTNFSYDALNRITARSYPTDPTENIAYTYDQTGPAFGFGIGRPTTVTDQAGTLKRTYDERGNVLADSRNGSVTGYAYDATSRVAAITYPSGAVATYTRDQMGGITGVSVTPSGGGRLSVLSGVAYAPFGPPTGLTYGNGIAESRAFDLDYRLTSLRDTGSGSARRLSYSYDANDNVVSLGDTLPGGNQTFAYDALNRLTSASGFYGALSYAYDPTGNVLSAGKGGTTAAFQYVKGSNRLAAVTQGSAALRRFAYIATGNVSLDARRPNPAASANTLILGYNAANRLSAVSGSAPGSPTYRYIYDALGQRLAKTRTGVPAMLDEYRYDLRHHVIEETDLSAGKKTVIDYIYLEDRPVAMVTGGYLFFLEGDRLDTPQIATTAHQTVAWEALYQPFGQIGPLVSSQTQNLRFPDQYADAESGYYQNGMRDYDPTLGRYLESDPIGLAGGPSTYLYAAANPLDFTDPNGLDGSCFNPGFEWPVNLGPGGIKLDKGKLAKDVAMGSDPFTTIKPKSGS
jgi:RHS repeat-associated protein